MSVLDSELLRGDCISSSSSVSRGRRPSSICVEFSSSATRVYVCLLPCRPVFLHIKLLAPRRSSRPISGFVARSGCVSLRNKTPRIIVRNEIAATRRLGRRYGYAAQMESAGNKDG